MYSSIILEAIRNMTFLIHAPHNTLMNPGSGKREREFITREKRRTMCTYYMLQGRSLEMCVHIIVCAPCTISAGHLAGHLTLIIIYLYQIAILHHGMQSFHIIAYCTPVYCTFIATLLIAVTALQLQYHTQTCKWTLCR